MGTIPGYLSKIPKISENQKKYHKPWASRKNSQLIQHEIFIKMSCLLPLHYLKTGILNYLSSRTWFTHFSTVKNCFHHVLVIDEKWGNDWMTFWECHKIKHLLNALLNELDLSRMKVMIIRLWVCLGVWDNVCTPKTINMPNFLVKYIQNYVYRLFFEPKFSLLIIIINK